MHPTCPLWTFDHFRHPTCRTLHSQAAHVVFLLSSILAADDWEVRTRAISAADQKAVQWHERLVLEAPRLPGGLLHLQLVLTSESVVIAFTRV